MKKQQIFLKYLVIFLIASCGGNPHLTETMASKGMVLSASTTTPVPSSPVIPEPPTPTLYSGLHIGDDTSALNGYIDSDFMKYLPGKGTQSLENFNSQAVASGLLAFSNTIDGVMYTIEHYDEDLSAAPGLLIGTARTFRLENPVGQDMAFGDQMGIDMQSPGSSANRNTFVYKFFPAVGHFGVDTLDLESDPVNGIFAKLRVYDILDNIIFEGNLDFGTEVGHQEVHFVGYISDMPNIATVQLIVGDDGAGDGKYERIAFDNLRFGTDTGEEP